MDDELRYSVKSLYRESLEYLYKVASESDNGYFYLNINSFAKGTDKSRRTIYNHIPKLSNLVFTVFKGTRYPSSLIQDLLIDSGKTFKGVGSLYYMPIAKHTGTFKYCEGYSMTKYSLETLSFNRDKAIFKYCFDWDDAKANHFIQWSESESNIYETYQKYLDLWDSEMNVEQIRNFIKSNDYSFLVRAAKDISDNGFYKQTDENLEQFFRYMVHGYFNWDNNSYMDKFLKLTG